MKKILILILLIGLWGCNSSGNVEETSQAGCDLIEDCSDTIDAGDNMTIKEKYEALNKLGERQISIPEDHPLIRVNGAEIVKKIENKETFYLYVGDEQCPWCRSVIEKFLETAAKANVDTIYYIEIWDEEGQEIFRDRYVYEDGELNKEIEGDGSYQNILKYFRTVLDDYVLSDDDGNQIEVGEKRILVPAFFYVEEGQLKRYTTGTSPLQEGSRDELSEEMLEDETDMFEEFFGLEE